MSRSLIGLEPVHDQDTPPAVQGYGYYLVEDGSAGYQASARITSNSYDRRDVRHLAAIEEHLPTYVLGNTCAVVSTMTNRTEGT